MNSSRPGYGHLGSAGLDDLVLGNLYDHRVVGRLLGYVLPYKLWVVASAVGMVGYIVTMVAQPLIIAWGINDFIVSRSGGDRWGNLHFVALVFLFNCVANMLFNLLMN